MTTQRVDEFHRLLVTGSRGWRDVEAIRWALRTILDKWGCRPDQIVVVQGMCDGADTIARNLADVVRIEKVRGSIPLSSTDNAQVSDLGVRASPVCESLLLPAVTEGSRDPHPAHAA